MVVMAYMCTSGVKGRRGRRGSSEQSGSVASVPANTSESSEANTEASGPAEGRCVAAAVPDNTAEELPTHFQQAEETGKGQHARFAFIMPEICPWTPCKRSHGATLQCSGSSLTGAAGLEGLDASAAAPETDGAAAERILHNTHTEDASRQDGAVQQPPPHTRDESAVNFWPDVDDAAAVNGEVEQAADERVSSLARTEPVEVEAPAEQREEAHRAEHAKADASAGQQREADADAEHAEQTTPQTSQHILHEDHLADELPEEAGQHSLTEEHVHAELEVAGMTGEHAAKEPEEASQHGSEEDDRLEELMGAVPTIDLRELRTQVASLPEILSRAERTAELCARGSAPGLPGLQGLSPHKLADGSIHSWVAQSRATAIMIQRDEREPRHHHSVCAAAAQPTHPHGDAERDMPRHEKEPGNRAEGSAAGSPESSQPDARRRLTAKRSLAEVRAAIGIIPISEPAATGYDTFQEPTACADPAAHMSVLVCM